MSNVVFTIDVTRPIPPDDRTRKRRITAPLDSGRHGDDEHTSIDGPKFKEAATNVDSHRLGDNTNVDGPRIAAPAGLHESELMNDSTDEEDTSDDVEDPTVYRGDRGAAAVVIATAVTDADEESSSASASRSACRWRGWRNSPASTKDELKSLRWAPTGRHRLVHDHVVLLARVLGIRPTSRHARAAASGRRPRDAAGMAIARPVQTALLAGPIRRSRARSGERFGGDLERVGDAALRRPARRRDARRAGWPKARCSAFVARRPQSRTESRHRMLVRQQAHQSRQSRLRRASADRPGSRSLPATARYPDRRRLGPRWRGMHVDLRLVAQILPRDAAVPVRRLGFAPTLRLKELVPILRAPRRAWRRIGCWRRWGAIAGRWSTTSARWSSSASIRPSVSSSSTRWPSG